jgi:7-cyano-7-deazaguanine reductase
VSSRALLQVGDPLPFQGGDIWTAYELSWLNQSGKPCVAMGEFFIPCESPYLIESKSLKMYLNSLNQKKFAVQADYEAVVAADLSRAAGAQVHVGLYYPDHDLTVSRGFSRASCLDHLDIMTDVYTPEPRLLTTSLPIVSEALYTDLFKSNCPVTGQPDWASVMVRYKGPQIERKQLLKYFVSYRGYSGFHENCVEKIFMDITTMCHAKKLTVYARFTRRGGLDINPFRSNFETSVESVRLFRQ